MEGNSEGSSNNCSLNNINASTSQNASSSNFINRMEPKQHSADNNAALEDVETEKPEKNVATSVIEQSNAFLRQLATKRKRNASKNCPVLFSNPSRDLQTSVLADNSIDIGQNLLRQWETKLHRTVANNDCPVRFSNSIRELQASEPTVNPIEFGQNSRRQFETIRNRAANNDCPVRFSNSSRDLHINEPTENPIDFGQNFQREFKNKYNRTGANNERPVRFSNSSRDLRTSEPAENRIDYGRNPRRQFETRHNRTENNECPVKFSNSTKDLQSNEPAAKRSRFEDRNKFEKRTTKFGGRQNFVGNNFEHGGIKRTHSLQNVSGEVLNNTSQGNDDLMPPPAIKSNNIKEHRADLVKPEECNSESFHHGSNNASSPNSNISVSVSSQQNHVRFDGRKNRKQGVRFAKNQVIHSHKKNSREKDSHKKESDQSADTSLENFEDDDESNFLVADGTSLAMRTVEGVHGTEYEILDDIEDQEQDGEEGGGESSGGSEVEEEVDVDQGPCVTDKGSTGGGDGREMGEMLDVKPNAVFTKTILVEKMDNPFEILPAGWVKVSHSSGMPIYLHKQQRVCTMGRPYFIGHGSVRRHDIPLLAIPCLQYRRASNTHSFQSSKPQSDPSKTFNSDNINTNCTTSHMVNGYNDIGVKESDKEILIQLIKSTDSIDIKDDMKNTEYNDSSKVETGLLNSAANVSNVSPYFSDCGNVNKINEDVGKSIEQNKGIKKSDHNDLENCLLERPTLENCLTLNNQGDSTTGSHYSADESHFDCYSSNIGTPPCLTSEMFKDTEQNYHLDFLDFVNYISSSECPDNSSQVSSTSNRCENLGSTTGNICKNPASTTADRCENFGSTTLSSCSSLGLNMNASSSIAGDHSGLGAIERSCHELLRSNSQENVTDLLNTSGSIQSDDDVAIKPHESKSDPFIGNNFISNMVECNSSQSFTNSQSFSQISGIESNSISSDVIINPFSTESVIFDLNSTTVTDSSPSDASKQPSTNCSSTSNKTDITGDIIFTTLASTSTFAISSTSDLASSISTSTSNISSKESCLNISASNPSLHSSTTAISCSYSLTSGCFSSNSETSCITSSLSNVDVCKFATSVTSDSSGSHVGINGFIGDGEGEMSETLGSEGAKLGCAASGGNILMELGEGIAKGDEGMEGKSEGEEGVRSRGVLPQVMPPLLKTSEGDMAKIECAEEHNKLCTVSSEELYDYCKNLFEFKTVLVKRFVQWKERRRFQKLTKQRNRPEVPLGTKLIKCPVPAKRDSDNNRRRDMLLNPAGKSPLSVLHEYCQLSIKVQPRYEYEELCDSQSPFSATIYLDDIPYGTGYAVSKKNAKIEAARIALEILIPGMKKYYSKAKSEQDLSFFDEIAVEDPRVAELSVKIGQPHPFQILTDCLKRNYGMGDTDVSIRLTNIKHQRSRLTMKVGKHETSVICKNKKEGKQHAAQLILKLMHPHIHYWGSMIRLYSNSAETKQKKEEEQSVTELQTRAEPNKAILSKLRSEMSLLYRKREALVSTAKGKVNLEIPKMASSDLGSVDL